MRREEARRAVSCQDIISGLIKPRLVHLREEPSITMCWRQTTFLLTFHFCMEISMWSQLIYESSMYWNRGEAGSGTVHFIPFWTHAKYALHVEEWTYSGSSYAPHICTFWFIILHAWKTLELCGGVCSLLTTSPSFAFTVKYSTCWKETAQCEVSCGPFILFFPNSTPCFDVMRSWKWDSSFPPHPQTPGLSGEWRGQLSSPLLLLHRSYYPHVHQHH